MKLISCPGGYNLTVKISDQLKNLTQTDTCFIQEVHWTNFTNSEFKIEITSSIRGEDVFIVQDCCNKKEEKSVSDSVMEMFIAIDAAKRAGARRINLVCPSFPFSRQHKKSGRESLTASMILRMLENLGIKNIVTLDLHSRELENSLANVVIENLHSSYQLLKELIPLLGNIKESCIVSPDTGSIERNKFFAQILETDLAMIYKERSYKDYSSSSCNISRMKLLGSVEGKNCVIFDDMIDTGGTILKAAHLLKESGANKIFICISLPFFNKDSIYKFRTEYEHKIFDKVIGTNAVFHPDLWNESWFQIAPIEKFLSKVIYKIHKDESISELLDSKNVINKLIQRHIL